MQTEFYVTQNGETKGPFPFEQIYEMILNKQLVSSDHIYFDETQNWYLLSEIPEFESYLNESILSETTPTQSNHLEIVSEEIVTETTEAPATEHTVEQVETIPTISDVQLTETFVAQEIETSPAPQIEIQSIESKAVEPQIDASEITPSSDPVTLVMELSAGEGVIEFTPSKQAELTISLDGTDLALEGDSILNVLPGEIHQLLISGPSSVVAGQPLLWNLQVVDQNQNTVVDCHDHIQITMTSNSGSIDTHVVELNEGHGSFAITPTTAELVYIHAALHTSQGNTFETHAQALVKAGPAKRVRIEKPEQIRAGQSAMLKAIIMDEFGNHVSTEQRSLSIQLKKTISAS